MKLGCKIFSCNNNEVNRGNCDIFSQNAFDTLPITDVRDIGIFTTQNEKGLLNPTQDKIFYILSFCEKGACLGVVAHHINGQRDDSHWVAWICIGKEVIQNAKTIEGIMSLIDEIKSQLNSQNNFDVLKILLNEEYAVTHPCTVPPHRMDIQNIQCAIEYFDNGDYDLKYILERLYQPAIYSNYDVIFLVDRQDGIEHDVQVKEIKVKDLKESRLISIDKIRKQNNISEDISIYRKDENGSNKEFWTVDEQPEICLKKDKFDELRTRVIGDHQLESTRFTKRITSNSFKISDGKHGCSICERRRKKYQQDGDGEQILGCTIKYNDKTIDKVGIDIAEADFKEDKKYISISKDGYETQTVVLKRLLKDDCIPITLRKCSTVYTYLVPDAKDCTKQHKLSVDTTDVISNEYCPIMGYVVDKESHYPNYKLKYDRWALFRGWKSLFPILAILLFFVMGFSIGRNFPHKEQSPKEREEIKRTEENVTVSDNEGEDSIPRKTTEPTVEGCTYLDNTLKWNRSEMEEIPELRGLWDALNEYDFRTVRAYGNTLRSSQKLNEIISQIGDQNLSGKFCGEGDFDITPQNYLKKINQNETIEPSVKVKMGRQQNPSNQGSGGTIYRPGGDI